MKIFFIVIALILFGVLIGVLASRFLPMNTAIAPTPTPTLMVSITPTPTIDPTAGWTSINLKSCSTRHANFEYSLKVPDGWTSKKVLENTSRTVSSFTNKSGSSIEINCDTAGVGSVVCVDEGIVDKPFNSDITTQNGCFWSADPKAKTYGAQYTVKNQFGSFVFRATGVEKTLLDQILSTFKFSSFTSSVPASWKTLVIENIEIKYPGNWKGPQYLQALTTSGKQAEVISPDNTQRIIVAGGINKGYSKNKLTSYLDSLVEGGGQRLTVAGSDAVKDTSNYQGSKTVTAYINSSDVTSQYFVTLQSPMTLSDENVNTFFDQILSTFKFSETVL